MEPVELIQDLEEVPGRVCDPVRNPDQDHIEAAAAGIADQLIKPWPAGLHSADAVGIFLHHFIAALSGHLPEVVQLGLGVPILAGDSHIKDGPFKPRRTFGCLVVGEFSST